MYGKNCLLLTSHLGLHQCLAASCMRVYYTVRYDVGNYNLGEESGNYRGISQCMVSDVYLCSGFFFRSIEQCGHFSTFTLLFTAKLQASTYLVTRDLLLKRFRQIDARVLQTCAGRTLLSQLFVNMGDNRS